MYQEQTLFPSFEGAKSVTIDLETHDPDLKTKGPGVRRDGYIVGAAVSVNGFKKYYPVAHRVGPNVDKDKVLNWLRSELKDYKGDILGANILYDLDYLAQENVNAPKATIRDIQIAEPLLDETKSSYALETLAQERLGEGKVESDLESMYGPKWKTMIRDCDSRMVGVYAMGDLDLPERIHAQQLVELEEQGLTNLYNMECRLLPMMLYMRRLGVPVDVAKAERVSNELYLHALDIRKQIKHLVGFDVNVNASDSIAKAFDVLGLPYGKTRTGKPSFTKNFLAYHPHPFAKLLMSERKALKTKGTFVDGYILDGHINGRIHCLFNQLKGDDSGTVSGRFSSSMPNLQNIPSRDEEIGPLMRSMFIPEAGCEWWARDWSQIEYRIFIHYAALMKLGGAADAAQRYHDDPDLDFHNMVAEMTGLKRKDAKNINFGILYGMGVPKLAGDLGRTIEEAQPILDQYHERIPFAKAIAKQASALAARTGYVHTILGRRRRFNSWEDGKYRSQSAKDEICREKGDPTWFHPVFSEAEAKEKWGGRPKRAYTHKAFNSVIQGSAADLMKMAMVKCWEDGVCDVLPIHLTVHDELDGSCDGSKAAREALDHVTHVMETVMPLKVPVRADGTSGANWAEAK